MVTTLYKKHISNQQQKQAEFKNRVGNAMPFAFVNTIPWCAET